MNQERQSATIKSYISAIKAVLREDGVKLEQDNYLLASLTKACKIKKDRLTIRFPIQKKVLRLLLNQADIMYHDQLYRKRLFRAMFATAYYGMFRVGEITRGNHPILAKNVHLGINKNKLLIYLESSKTHSKGSDPQIVKINELKKNNHPQDSYCPFNILREFLIMRPGFKSNSEPFFVFRDRSAVTPYQFRSVLKMLIKQAGLEDKYFNCHSFRVGRSIDLLRMGVSVETIKK